MKSEKAQPDDLQPIGFPELEWSTERLRESLDRLRDYSVAQGNNANEWYLSKRKGKRRMGQTLRVSAILLAAAGGLVPVVSQLWQSGGTPIVEPGWSPLLLGLTALCIMLDKFLGSTSAWLRYLTASQDIGEILRKFRFDWELRWAALGNAQPTAEQTQGMIKLCRTLLADVDRIVQEETRAWVTEFRSVLKQVDLAAEKAPKATTLGGIEIEVINGDQVATGWKLKIDDGTESRHSGKAVTVPSITPGIHKVSVSGTIDGATKVAEQEVEVRAGAMEQISLALA